MLKAGEINENYIQYVFEKFKESTDKKRGAWIYAGIVKKKYIGEYQINISAKPVYKPKKPVAESIHATFQSFEYIKQYSSNYEQNIADMRLNGWFDYEKDGVKGLGKY